jgi:hypothetical protein
MTSLQDCKAGMISSKTRIRGKRANHAVSDVQAEDLRKAGIFKGDIKNF